ncbi:PIG-L deacetylase family protein [Pseudomonas sp. GV071]|uniref:PIG-L deacetylase family protein n=1 Tax=Pseudomonas sp. GV071 TaxID=2135754 RepID=UPI000D3B6F4F|nr:PIG-L family deacetylase [Pseudomonas sp. GV071]PTQ68405.1 LmbE family N-acetylglucosaminyl deacetylase [Pseudomonas sp. GV071]
MKPNLINSQLIGTPLQAWNHSRRLSDVQPIELQQLLPAGARAVVVAPHPDDEILGCGGLMQLLGQQQIPMLLVSVTAGTASNLGSHYWTPQRLSIARPLESAQALRRLGLDQSQYKWLHSGLPDTQVHLFEEELTQFLLSYLLPNDVLFTTWRSDGHSDHEATARACLAASQQLGVPLCEVPIWAWHWADPEDSRIPWERARKLHLDTWTQARKRHAIQAFASQIHPDPQADLPPVLPACALERLQQPFELLFV